MTTVRRPAPGAKAKPNPSLKRNEGKCLFGIETEYAFAGRENRARQVRRILRLAARRLPHMRGERGCDLFLANGARFYLDVGNHPEYCTPECSDPADLVRHLRAGDQIMAELVAAVEAGEDEEDEARGGNGDSSCTGDESSGSISAIYGELEDEYDEDDEIEDDEPVAPFAPASMFKCNVDYSGEGSTWGSHESYLYRTGIHDLPRGLIPHLLSRIIYTGAGGFVPDSPGIKFTLAPRTFRLDQVVAANSTHHRGIFHFKDETLSGAGYHRMHLLCGESLCSELATWLRVGTTALVTAMTDQGLEPGRSVTLEEPLESMRAFSLDPTCQQRADATDGRELRAVDIQRHYLEMAEANLGRPFMPAWAEEVCRKWRWVLDLLETNPSALSRTLDWAIKLPIYRRHAEAAGIAWDKLTNWSWVVGQLQRALRRVGPEGRMCRVEDAARPGTPIPEVVEELTSYLEGHDLRWEDLRAFVLLRRELLEIDIRFGQLGPEGIFNRLNAAGVLTHRAPGVEEIDDARVRPPAGGRAELRGKHILEMRDRNEIFCQWQGIWDLGQGRFIDMSDPFATEASWRDQPPSPRMRRLMERQG